MGEYIDRQAVLDAIWPVDHENDGSDGCTVVLKNCIFSSEEIEALVCDIPAADVRPVIHAFWDSDERCSSCGEKSTENLDAEIWGIWEPDFCPHCGAKMDGGANQ